MVNQMKIDILCSSATHPIFSWLEDWATHNSKSYDINLSTSLTELYGGDILFLVSCTEKIPVTIRANYENCFVLHASDLPQGKGWSPHIWSILNGDTELTVSLISATDKIDEGDIWAKKKVIIPPDALYDEINSAIFNAEIELMQEALKLTKKGHKPIPQRETNIMASTYPRRYPSDSEIDPKLPLVELFNQIRVADPHRYPAFFKLHNHVYSVQIKKVDNNDPDND